ncbi:hypothetical protein N7504_010244 [Penicillium tannophilum]|nr:hypothetical protein N7504_010244 [Penicillium tannophilum]
MAALYGALYGSRPTYEGLVSESTAGEVGPSAASAIGKAPSSSLDLVNKRIKYESAVFTLRRDGTMASAQQANLWHIQYNQ